MALNSISPIDGRYEKYTKDLVKYFGEVASMKYQLLVECEYLIALSEIKGVGVRRLNKKEKKVLRKVYNDFSIADAQIIDEIEFRGYKKIKATNHDFKAIEYFLKEKLKTTSLKDIVEFIHFGLTSWDAIGTGYGLRIDRSVKEIYLPALKGLVNKIRKLAKSSKNIPMLARTHGQPASPTTFGKEFKVFEERLKRQISQIENRKIMAKLNGATGNYNALAVAYPKIDWIKFSKKFIRSLGLEPNLITTQIEPYDSFIELFDAMRRINSILIGFDQDVWRYVSDGWIGQRTVAGEIGSSTMPHKINPWFLENSEGNLGLANALFEFFARKLPISRLQRDLSDSTVLRNIGTALGHSLIGFKYLNNQLDRVVVNKKKAKEDLENHPEVIAEALQTILRREGVEFPYEKLKALTRGKNVVKGDFDKFIEELPVAEKIKKELKKITPLNYTGLASKIAVL